MFKLKSTQSLGSLCKNILFLTIGFLIGIRSTTFWYYLQNYTLPETPSTWATYMDGSTTQTATAQPQYLFNTTRVLCWILTNPANHLTKAIHIRHTWGRRCNKLLFMSSQEDKVLPTVKLDVEEGRHNLWNKTKKALKYIYDHHIDDAEWFLKADDDTYVIMENLRYFLYQHSSEVPIYFGAKFKPFIKQGYMSGGAGYVLSKESLRKFALEAFDNPNTCPKVYTTEDVQLGFCLENIGVIAGDSRDEEGKERFMPLAVEHLMPLDISMWYKKYTFYSQKGDATCCSASAISFHYVKPNQFYIMEYFLYILRPFGVIGTSNYSLPKKLVISDATKK